MRARKNLHSLSRVHAFTLVEIMIVVGILGILLIIAVPAWIRARAKAQGTVCQQNLTQIDGAKQVWAFENNKGDGAEIALEDLVAPYRHRGYLKRVPICPGEGTYTANVIGVDPVCSINTEGREKFADAQYLHKLR